MCVSCDQIKNFHATSNSIRVSRSSYRYLNNDGAWYVYRYVKLRGELAHRYDSGSRKATKGEGSASRARVNEKVGERRPNVNPFYTPRGHHQSHRRACPFQRRPRRRRTTTSCARISKLNYRSREPLSRGGDRQHDRELVEEAVRWNRDRAYAASERESREEIAERGGRGINKVEETGVRLVGGDGRQRIPTGNPPQQTQPLFCPGAHIKSWDATLFPTTRISPSDRDQVVRPVGSLSRGEEREPHTRVTPDTSSTRRLFYLRTTEDLRARHHTRVSSGTGYRGSSRVYIVRERGKDRTRVRDK